MLTQYRGQRRSLQRLLADACRDCDRAIELLTRRECPGANHRRERAFHVRRSSPPNPAARSLAAERIAPPLLRARRRDDVGVTVEVYGFAVTHTEPAPDDTAVTIDPHFVVTQLLHPTLADDRGIAFL